MTNTTVSKHSKALPEALSDTSPLQGEFLAVEAHDIPRGYFLAGGFSESEPRMSGRQREGIAEVLDESIARAFAVYGLVPQDVSRFEKSVVSEWPPETRNEQTYQVRAVVTGDTLHLGTIAAGNAPYLRDLFFRDSLFQQSGLIDLTFRVSTEDKPTVLCVDTSFYPRSLRYCLNAQYRDLSSRSVGMGGDSTDLEPGGRNLEGRIADLVSSSARGSRFEDGLESTLSRALVALFESEGKSVLVALAKAITKADSNVVAEILRTVARFEGAAVSEERRWLLEAGLSSRSPLVRDVAISGLMTHGDRRSIAALKKAIAQERIAPLRADMEELVRDLEGEPRAKAS